MPYMDAMRVIHTNPHYIHVRLLGHRTIGYQRHKLMIVSPPMSM